MVDLRGVHLVLLSGLDRTVQELLADRLRCGERIRILIPSGTLRLLQRRAASSLVRHFCTILLRRLRLILVAEGQVDLSPYIRLDLLHFMISLLSLLFSYLRHSGKHNMIDFNQMHYHSQMCKITSELPAETM